MLERILLLFEFVGWYLCVCLVVSAFVYIGLCLVIAVQLPAMKNSDQRDHLEWGINAKLKHYNWSWKLNMKFKKNVKE